jgi:hypothetical protein
MKRGFPRPKTHINKSRYGKKWSNRDYPHPYSASDDSIALVSESRNIQIIKFKMCSVCGEQVRGKFVHLLVNVVDPQWTIHHESGPFHERCIIIALKMCPEIAESGKYEHAIGEWKYVRSVMLG